MLDLNSVTYQTIEKEMEPVIRRFLLKQEDRSLAQLKLTKRDSAYLEVVVLDSMYDIWLITFSFTTSGKWERNAIQSAAHPQSCSSIFTAKKNKLKQLGISDKFIQIAADNFFSEISTFEKTEQAEKQLEKQKQDAKLKEQLVKKLS